MKPSTLSPVRCFAFAGLLLTFVLPAGVAAATCGAPAYAPGTEKAVLLWKSCSSDTWSLEVTGGGDPAGVTYEGELTTRSSFTTVTPVGLENHDSLGVSADSSVADYRFRVWNAATDGLAFSFPDGARVCVDVDLPADAAVYVGSDRVPATPPFDLESQGSCDGGATIDDVLISESGGAATFTVRLGEPPTVPVSIDFTTVDGTALAGSDFEATSGVLTFDPSLQETSKNIEVALIDDTTVEQTESFRLALSNPVNTAIAKATGEATVLDDETPAASCGQPDYAAGSERGLFLWQDCTSGGWSLRVVGGGSSNGLRYTGELTASGGAFSGVSGRSLENSDVLDVSTDRASIDFVLKVLGAGWDGFDFDVPAAAGSCFSLADLPWGAEVYVGADRVVQTVPFDLDTLGECDDTPVTPPPNPGPTPGLKNVLFISVDDLRPELGVYGVNEISTPGIDALAAQGVTFSRAYAQMATCSPSRTSYMTGLRPDTTRVTDLGTHFRSTVPSVVTLPQYFKQNGYRTQGICKVYHGGLDDPQSWSEPSQDAYGPGAVYGPDGKRLAYAAVDTPDWNFADHKCANRAIDAIWDAGDTPFFIAVGFKKPHLPFLAPPEYFDMYDKYAIPEADNLFRSLNAPSFAFADSAELGQYSQIPANNSDFDETLRRELKHAYYASTTFVDKQIDRLLDELEFAGRGDDTIVVLTGDHGFHLGEQNEWGKHTNFEMGTRVPLIIRAPGRPTGVQRSALVELVDLYPTIVELAGLPIPTTAQHGGYPLEGDSLVPIIDDPDLPSTRGAFSQWRRAGYVGHSIRTPEWRFNRWVNGSGNEVLELYDQVADPGETINVANYPRHAEIIEMLKDALSAGGKQDLPTELQ